MLQGARSYLDGLQDKFSKASALDVSPDPSQDVKAAQQQFKADCDINTLMKHYDPMQLNVQRQALAEYLDISELGDYQHSLEVVSRASDAFAELPAKVRSEFGNDPGKFMEFMHDPKNLDRAVELGIATRREVEAVKEDRQFEKISDDDQLPLKVPKSQKKKSSEETSED